MLEIKNLHASVGGKEILKGLNLTVRSGEIHAIMGPNGAGKSSLLSILANEIKDHIAWNVYELKKKHNIQLKLKEEKIIVELYKKMAFGEYGNSHRAARAIGLWLWDQRNRNEDIHSDRAAVRALRDKKLDVEHQASDDRTLLRLLENAKKCIEKGQVVAINKQSGRPKKAHAV